MNRSLTPNLKDNKKELVELVLKIAAVEKIYLLGECLHRKCIKSIFLTNTHSNDDVLHYYLLVLVNDKVAYSNDDLQDRIENNCQNLIPATAIILNSEQFLRSEGNSFAAKVLSAAELLYTDSDSMLTENSVLKPAGQTQNNNYWTADYNTANEFLNGARLYLLRQQNKMFRFMLHQATILLLQCILKKRAGYTTATRNIDKLLRYCSMVAEDIPGIFPRDNEKERRLFQLLLNKKGKEELAIRRNEAEILMGRVDQIQLICATVGLSF